MNHGLRSALNKKEYLGAFVNHGSRIITVVGEPSYPHPSRTPTLSFPDIAVRNRFLYSCTVSTHKEPLHISKLNLSTRRASADSSSWSLMSADHFHPPIASYPEMTHLHRESIIQTYECSSIIDSF